MSKTDNTQLFEVHENSPNGPEAGPFVGTRENAIREASERAMLLVEETWDAQREAGEPASAVLQDEAEADALAPVFVVYGSDGCCSGSVWVDVYEEDNATWAEAEASVHLNAALALVGGTTVRAWLDARAPARGGPLTAAQMATLDALGSNGDKPVVICDDERGPGVFVGLGENANARLLPDGTMANIERDPANG